MKDLDDKFAAYKNAIDRYEEIINSPHEFDGKNDAIIKRFEFTFELSWKMLRIIMLEVGLNFTSPLASFKDAYQNGWIDDEEIWINILKDRNKIVHIYSSEFALEVVERSGQYLAVFRKLYNTLYDLYQ